MGYAMAKCKTKNAPASVRSLRSVRAVLRRLFLVAILCAPLAAWGFCKPVRLVMPTLAGMSRITGNLYSDTPSQAEDATKLYNEAFNFVGLKIGAIKSCPRVVFCANVANAQFFGLGRASAMTADPCGILIGPRAWKPYYVRHELIHHLQYEHLGLYRYHRCPAWFIEGMAYSLSEDPRVELPQPAKNYRSKFEAWMRSINKGQLWEEARKL